MKFFPLMILMMCVALPFGYGQSAKAFEKAGDKAFNQKNYSAALEYYRNALEMKPKKISLSYKYAEVARLFHAYDFAVQYYSKVLDHENAKDFPLTHFWLGKVRKGMGNYEMAKSHFEKYLQSDNVSDLYRKEAKAEIESCEWAMEVVKNETQDVAIQQLNKRVNSPYTEFGPLMSGDTLYYSSLRFDNINDEHEPPRKITKVLTSVKGSKGRQIGRGFNDKTKHTAHTTFSQNKDKLYYTVCEYKGEVEIRCELFYRVWNKKRKRWDKGKKLPEDINLPGFTATHPNIGFDKQTGEETLYFVSDRPEGKGNLDIWYTKISKTGKFSKPENLAEINTTAHDITPFFHNSTNTLFFSSEGYTSLGGYDIYKTKKINGKWAVPQHTGYPLNSSYNDVYFSLNADSTQAFISSNRLGSMYLEETNKSCCNDIYKVTIKPKDEIEFIPPVEDSLTIVFEPEIDPEPEPEPIPEDEIPPTTLEDFLPLALYFDNDEPDKRTRRTTTKKSYAETFARYYPRKPEFKRQFTKGLEGEEKIIEEEELEEFFEYKVKRGFDYLGLFSDILLKRLQEGEQVEIFVKGFTSPRAKSDYNLNLGKRRISSVKNHFKTYQNNIFQPYLESGQLKISERSFGETTVASGVNDDLDNQRLSIYSVGASVERRVEIVEIQRQ